MKKLVAVHPAPGRLTVLAALLAGLSAPAMAASPNLVISQIYGAGGNAGTTFYKNDYIEIFNRGTTAVTATGWSLQYASAANNVWSNRSVLPTSTPSLASAPARAANSWGPSTFGGSFTRSRAMMTPLRTPSRAL